MKKIVIFLFFLVMFFPGACLAQGLTKAQSKVMDTLIDRIHEDLLAADKEYNGEFMPNLLRCLSYAPNGRKVIYWIPPRPDKSDSSQRVDHIAVNYYPINDTDGFKIDFDCSPEGCIFPDLNARVCLNVQMDEDDPHEKEVVARVREIVIDNCKSMGAKR